jgi:serine/threonine protein kinase
MTDRRIGSTLGQYQIEKLVGNGGMAGVYQAIDTRTTRTVALKLMHPHLASQKSFQDAFMQEANAIARLSHPNIVRVLAFETIADELVLVMEYIAGGNLRQYIKTIAEEGRSIPLTHSVDVIIQLANALGYAHGQGMMHRDMKPDNVVLQPFSSAKDLFPFRPIITDFGLARLSSSDENAITDQPLGTYAYMSPEQCLGEKIDTRTDIYSLGIMLYELTVGQLPYKPQTIAEAARYHGREELPLPTALLPDYPYRLEAVVAKSLAKKAEDRYQTATELSKALLSLRGEIVRSTQQLPKVVPTTTPAPPVEPPIVAPVETAPPTPEMSQPLYRPGTLTDLSDALDFSVGSMPIFSANPTESKPPTPPASIPPKPETYEVDGAVLSLYDVTPPPETLENTEQRVLESLAQPPMTEAPTVLDPPTQTYNIGGAELSLYDTTPDPTHPDNIVNVDGAMLSLYDRTPEPGAEANIIDVDGAKLSVFDVTPASNATQGEPPLATVIKAPSPQISVPTREGISDGLTTVRMKTPLQAQVPRMLKIPDSAPKSPTGDYLVGMNVMRHSYVFPITKDVISLGTAPDQDIQLDAEYVSRRHLQITRKDNYYEIVDLGTTNGTWYDTQQLAPMTALRRNYGEVFRVGEYWLAVLRDDHNQERGAKGKPVTVTVRKMATGEIPVPLKPATNTSQATTPGVIKITPPGTTPAPVAKPPQPSPTATLLTPEKPSRTIDDALERTIINPDDLKPLVEATPEVQIDKGLEGKVINNYRLDRFLGQGSVASVYAATDLRLNRPVALKILSDSLAIQEPYRRSFLEEARIASTLDHPNIVRVMGYEQTDGYVFLVMELVAGGSLRQYMRRLRKEDRVMSYAEGISMGKQLADALHYAHQQGLVHRDIKPDNIVLREVTGDGETRYQPVLTDFGLANVSAVGMGESFITDQTAVMYPYMSPEDVMGARVDTRSDVYEIGIVIYELAVGQVPFQPRSLAEAIRMHSREPVVRPSDLRADIPRELERTILRCLEKDPNSRYQTAIELSRTLDSIGKNLERQAQEALAPVVDDPFKTSVMNKPIDVQMPYFTPQPVSDDQIGYDRLIVYSEKFPSIAFRIESDIITLGRDPNATINLESQAISRRHARIERFGNAYRLIDLGSRNGTYMGNTRLLPNVAEVWDSVRTVRMGDYWLRLESNVQPSRLTTRQSLALTNLDDGNFDLPDGATLDDEFAEPTYTLPSPDHDKVGLTVIMPIVNVQPGQSVAIPLEIHNRSTLVDHFVISVEGLPLNWVTIHTEPIYLLPNNRETASITLHPPLASTSSAGAHAFEITVTARAQNIRSVAQQCSLNVLPYYNFNMDLSPQRVRGRGRTEIEIVNTGNTFDTYTVQARDREQAIRFQADGRQFTLPPGQGDFINIRLIPLMRPWFGAAQTLPFEVIVRSQQEGVASQTQNGEFVVRSRIPSWLLIFSLLICGVCGLLTFLLYTQYNNTIIANATATVVAFITSVPVTETAYALADDDNDTLPNAKEIELGTDPLLPDTDADGIIDGEEVRIWRTDPLKFDTDGDKLSDGQEVRDFGTDPLDVDTDGDEIPDNEDTTPAIKSTLTPTPFATIFGSNGDICPGSPPSRLTVGIEARVEPGGVNNRLRDAPGIQKGKIIAYLRPGSLFQIIGGPTCDTDDFIRWWQVDANGLQGWTAEGEGEEYYLGPKDGEGGDAPSGGSASADVQANTNSALVSLPPLDASALDRSKMGFQVASALDSGRWATALSFIDQTKVNWLKIQVNWSELQPDSPTDFGAPFQALQSNLALAKGKGYKLMLSIVNAPTWARAVAYSQPGPPDDPQSYGLFLTFLLNQVGGSVDAIEVWNEPNIKREWTGALSFDGKGYMQLFDVAYEAIRAYSPDIQIITAGLAPTVDTPTSVDDRKFLRQMLDNGLGKYTDIRVGVHPYAWANPPEVRCCVIVEGRGYNNDPRFYFLDNLETYKTILNDYGNASKLWITEFGYSTWAGFSGTPAEPWLAYLTPDEQAAYTVKAFQISQSLDYVEGLILWNLNFGSAELIERNSPFIGFSLILRDSEQRPTFQQLIKP